MGIWIFLQEVTEETEELVFHGYRSGPIHSPLQILQHLRGKSAFEANELHQSEWSGNVNHPTQRIIFIGFMKFYIVSRRPQRIHETSHSRQVGEHPQINVLGEPDISMRGKSNGTDHHARHVRCRQHPGNPVRHLQVGLFFVLQASLF